MSYSDFLARTQEKMGDKVKFSRYFLTTLVGNLDKEFVVDLTRVTPFLLPVDQVLSELLDFIEFIVNKSDILDLAQAFQSFVVSL